MEAPIEDRLNSILFPEATRHIQDVKKHRRRFVHYTSAQVAASIIRERRVWMRNASTMNDFMEVDHGLDMLIRTYNGAPGAALKSAIDEVFPGTSKWLQDSFNPWQPALRHETYITCVSVHRDEEDVLGRLSMWRAYGGDTGVALVMNSDVFQRSSHALKAYSSPVTYPTREEYERLFAEIAGNVFREREFLQSVGEAAFKDGLFNMCYFAALCTKHPGFKEEQEWRVTHTPQMYPSERLESSIEVVRGTVQRVYKIPLKDVPEEGLVGLALPSLLNRIIIGPTEHPRAMAAAFRDLLRDAEVEDADSKVWVSDLPLRQG